MNISNKRKKIYKNAFIILISSISSLGSLIYGYHFSKYYFSGTQFELIFGIIFAITSTGANAVIGTFALLKIDNNQLQFHYTQLDIIFSIFSSIPTGCICFFGYQNLIPIYLNLLLSLVVFITNTAINFVAIQYFIKDVLYAPKKHTKLTSKELYFKILGYLIASLVALAPFLAAAAGTNEIFHYYELHKIYEYNISVVIGALSFIPLACLYGYTNTKIIIKITDFIVKSFRSGIRLNILVVCILLFSIFSGVALAQIMREFLSPEKNIPILFKTNFVQSIVNFLVFLAWYSSSSATFYCIDDLLNSKDNSRL